MSTRVIIVDDHPIIRNALVASLLSLNLFDEVATAASFHELLEKLKQDSAYELLILDLSLTDISGSDGMVYVREHYPGIPIVIFSGSDSIEIVEKCFESGVHGFVSKNSPMQIFVQAIQIVLAGGVYVPPSVTQFKDLEPTDIRKATEAAEDNQLHFTPKQREVFEKLMLGVPNKVIARELGIAEGTVKAHLHSIYQSLRVKNRAQAIIRAQQLQIIA